MTTKYFMNGGVDSNWSTDGNWSTTASTGPANTTKAVAADAVILNAGSPNCTIDVASAANSINCTGYTNTLTFNSILTMTGAITFVSGMTIAGTTGTLQNNGSGGQTFTTANKTLTCAFGIGDSTNFIVSGTLTVNGLVTTATNSSCSSGIIVCTAGLTSNLSTFGASGGSTLFQITGGTWQQTYGGNGDWRFNTTISGNCTITGSLRFGSATLTWASGTITWASSPKFFFGGSTTLSGWTGSSNSTGQMQADMDLWSGAAPTLATNFNCSGTYTNTTSLGGLSGAFTATLGAWTISGTNTAVTLGATFNIAGALTLNGVSTTVFSGTGAITAASCQITNAKTITLSGNVTVSGLTTVTPATVINGAFNWNTASLTVNGALSGTSTIIFNGTGTWQGSSWVTNNLIINTAGTLTLSGTIRYLTGTLTYTAGTVSLTGTPVLSLEGSCTLNTSGITWTTITITTAATITLNSFLSISGTLTLPDAAVTWAGSFGFTCATLINTINTASRTTTWAAAVAYTITSSLTTINSNTQAQRLIWTSSSGTVKAIITLMPGATQNVGFLDPTRIDSNNGQKIFGYRATITDSFNWTNVIPFRPGPMAIGRST